MKKILLIIPALLVACAVQADTITQTRTFSGQPNYSSVLTFNQFDNHGGAWTLESIYISVVLNTASGAYLGIDNDGLTSADGTVSFGSNGSITGSSVTLLTPSFTTFYAALVSTSSKQMLLDADDGDSTVFSTSGSDYDSMVTAYTSTDANTYIASAVFAQYTGTGTYTITYGVNQYMNIGAFSGVQFQGDPTTADGSITVAYNYIPEPATASMMAVIAGLGFLIRRRFLA
jgi:hypothetical protein